MPKGKYICSHKSKTKYTGKQPNEKAERMEIHQKTHTLDHLDSASVELWIPWSQAHKTSYFSQGFALLRESEIPGNL